MATVVLERLNDPPMRLDDIAAMEAQAAWCLEQHRVDHVLSLLSHDGRSLLCAFAAPDAEAVRRVTQQLGMTIRTAWAATLHLPPGQPADASLAAANPAAIVVVERAFAEPVEFAAVRTQAAADPWCRDQYGVRFLRTYFALDRRRMICLYAAPDAESVRIVQRQIGLPHERVWNAQLWETRAS
ncbi:MAG TPA: DUF4242 domain-containing protein [Candidatus Dormibacteraeota bacterium]|nr:DUF4242 domain-containing protein [Candidatus Dormibacteraeota bacterium]